MLWINRPTIATNCAVVAQCLSRLDVAAVTSPADGLQSVQIKEQFEVTFMRFKVVYDRAAWVIPTRSQMHTTTAVLASVFVPRECLTP